METKKITKKVVSRPLFSAVDMRDGRQEFVAQK